MPVMFNTCFKPKVCYNGHIYEKKEYEAYKGSYSVTPKVYEQYLDTTNKIMKDDVTVEAIPYYETSNMKGTTVIIG